MGDRCYCQLLTLEPMPDELLDLIEKWDSISIDRSEPITLLEFEEVNYGSLDSGIRNWLIDHRMPYAWETGSGYDYGPQVELFDGQTKVVYDRLEGHLTLTLRQFETPEVLETARKWQNFYDKFLED